MFYFGMYSKDIIDVFLDLEKLKCWLFINDYFSEIFHDDNLDKFFTIIPVSVTFIQF